MELPAVFFDFKSSKGSGLFEVSDKLQFGQGVEMR